MRKQFKHVFTVKGHGTFPFDMLRRDSCYPSSEQQSHKLDTPRTPRRRLEDREVQLEHHGPGDWTPLQERWVSFGWPVTSHIRLGTP